MLCQPLNSFRHRQHVKLTRDETDNSVKMRCVGFVGKEQVWLRQYPMEYKYRQAGVRTSRRQPSERADSASAHGQYLAPALSEVLA